MTRQDLTIGRRRVGEGWPTYFVADIGANHDGDIARARHLIHLAAEAGADAAKFQHFAAETIVSDRGFRALPAMSHQAGWEKSVFDVYADASIDPGWTPTLKAACDEAEVDFFTSPYSIELADAVDQYVCAFKIGSGDITWLELVEHIARKGKPVLLATGASDLDEVRISADLVLANTSDLVLMQCNTNYTGSRDTLRHVNLNVLRMYRLMYPDLVLGLSDHTPGHAAVLGAVALGARVVEKHFTDDTSRAGPDHPFSLDPDTWRQMVDRTRELEDALGSSVKQVEENERETVVAQRRALRASRTISAGTVLARSDIVPLRPCPTDAIPASGIAQVVGATLRRQIEAGDHLRWDDLR